MKAIISRDRIYISYDNLLGIERTVALYEVPTNTLRMTDGHSKALSRALKVLRKAQRQYHMEVSPVKLEYW